VDRPDTRLVWGGNDDKQCRASKKMKKKTKRWGEKPIARWVNRLGGQKLAAERKKESKESPRGETGSESQGRNKTNWLENVTLNK